MDPTCQRGGNDQSLRIVTLGSLLRERALSILPHDAPVPDSAETGAPVCGDPPSRAGAAFPSLKGYSPWHRLPNLWQGQRQYTAVQLRANLALVDFVGEGEASTKVTDVILGINWLHILVV